MDNQAHLKTWNVYQSAWGPIDEEERRRLLGISVADDILYTDPVSQVRCLEKLVARIGQSQERFAGAYFRNDSFLEHHDQGLFQWTMYTKNGDVFVRGTSFGHFGLDGRLVHATGFFPAPVGNA